jgi:hypothetical protein
VQLYILSYVGFILAGEIKSVYKLSLRVKCWQAVRNGEDVQALRDCATMRHYSTLSVLFPVLRGS